MKGKTRLVAWNSITYEEVFLKEFDECPAFTYMVIRNNEVLLYCFYSVCSLFVIVLCLPLGLDGYERWENLFNRMGLFS